MAQEKRTERNRNGVTSRSAAGSSTASSPATTERQQDTTPQREERSHIPDSRVGRPYSVQDGGHPYSLMRRMAEDMDRLFDSFGFTRIGLSQGLLRRSLLDDAWLAADATSQAPWSPQVETFRRGDKLVVRADLPGLRKEDIRIEVEDGVLTISGERRHEEEADQDGFWRSERSYGRFVRSLPLPDGTDQNKIDASFRDGVLEVEVRAPQKEGPRGRRVNIR